MGRFEKGRVKTGGRIAGTKNRSTDAVIAVLQELGCDPIRKMAEIAMDDAWDAAQRITVLKELAGYVAPKLKSIEHSGAFESAAVSKEVTRQDLIDAITGDPFIRISVKDFEEKSGI